MSGLTDEEKAKAVEMREAGDAYYKIASALGRKDVAIAEYLKSVGHGSKRFTWTGELEDRIVSLFRAEHTITQIREITGIGHTAISHKLSDLGVRAYNYAPRHPDKDTARNEKGGWDNRTFLPWAEYKLWRQEKRRMENAERV